MFIPTPSPPGRRDEVTISFSLHLGMEGERLTEVCTNFTPLPSQGRGRGGASNREKAKQI